MIDPPLDHSEFERWREDAARGLRGARILAEGGIHNWACFTCEQSAQLALKALLHGIGRGARGHDLVELAKVAQGEGIEVPTPALDAMRRLARTYTNARYPDTHEAGTAADHYGESDAEQALVDAETVIELVNRSWEELSRA